MDLILESAARIRLRAAGEGLEVSSADPEVQFSPLHMLAASLATCTVSVLAAWADAAGLGVEDLEIELSWAYVEDPYRVGHYDLVLHWPSLSKSRHCAATRVAAQCTVETTLRHGTEIRVGMAPAS